MPPVQKAAATTWTRSAAIEIGRPSQARYAWPARVGASSRASGSDEGRCDQLRPGARERCEQDAGERHDHRDLRDPLEARRRAVCGVDEPGAAERDGEQGDRHRRRRPAHRRPRDEQEEEGRPARDQDAAEEEPAGEHVEGSRAASDAAASTERGAPAPGGRRADAEGEHPRLEVTVVREHAPADAVVAVRKVRPQRQDEEVVLPLEAR